jgi:hypothetical protein
MCERPLIRCIIERLAHEALKSVGDSSRASSRDWRPAMRKKRKRAEAEIDAVAEHVNTKREPAPPKPSEMTPEELGQAGK